MASSIALAQKPQFLPLSNTYPLSDFRQFMMDVMNEGVGRPFDLAVSQRSAGGANMSVDVHGADSGGPAICYILGDTTPGVQGIYRQRVSEATPNIDIASNAAGADRVDLIVVRIDDPAATGYVERVQGTAGSGVPATPANTFCLAEVTVPPGAATITNAMITDRRVRAKRPVYTAFPAADVNFPGSWGELIPLPQIKFARDCTVRLEASIKVSNTGTLATPVDLSFVMDGAFVGQRRGTQDVAGSNHGVEQNPVFTHSAEVDVAAGNHTFKLQGVRQTGLSTPAMVGGTGVFDGRTSYVSWLKAIVF